MKKEKEKALFKPSVSLINKASNRAPMATEKRAVFTAQEKSILRALVVKELAALKREEKKMAIANSPFLGKPERSDDLAFLKSEKLAQQFLERLARKLKKE